MAQKPASKAVQPIKEPAQPLNNSYRAERISTYEWQAFKTTLNSDGTSTTEPIFKPNTIGIVLAKISNAIKDEGSLPYLAKKSKGA